VSLAARLHDGERAARDARHALGVGATAPIADLLALIEDQGTLVLVERFGVDKIAGVLLRHDDGESFVAVNADHWPGRQRFTLAHELGHLCMDHAEGVDWTSDLFGSSRSRDQQEIEANYFAAELLAPRAGIFAWLERTEIDPPGKISVETVMRLAFHYGVAFSTTCYRLERAGAISKLEKARLLQRLGERPDWRALGLQPFKDTLQALWNDSAYPRAPRQTILYAKAALEALLIDEDEFTAIVGAHKDVELDESWFY
jgi:Zn-dependent peptidase ImmA (M78 family)